MIEKRELSKKTINLNDLGPFDSNRIDPRALRDLQNRSEARPGPPWGPPGPLYAPRATPEAPKEPPETSEGLQFVLWQRLKQ